MDTEEDMKTEAVMPVRTSRIRRVLFFLHHHGPLSFAKLAEYIAARPAVLFGPADEIQLRMTLYGMWQRGLIAGAKDENEALVGWELTAAGHQEAASL